MSPPSRWNRRSAAPIAPSSTSTAAATSVALRRNALGRWRPEPPRRPTEACTYHRLVTHSGADPQTLAVLGDSAGGNLAVAVTAAPRDQGLALPIRILISPLADLTLSGAAIEERKHLDPLVIREMLESTVTEYLADGDPCDPPCSAIFADMHGFPRCSSRSARTKSFTTMPPASEMLPPPQVSTWPSTPGGMESTSGRYSSLPGNTIRRRHRTPGGQRFTRAGPPDARPARRRVGHHPMNRTASTRAGHAGATVVASARSGLHATSGGGVWLAP